MHSQGSDPHLSHANTYHKLSNNDFSSNKRNSFVNPPDIIAENVAEEESSNNEWIFSESFIR